MILFIISIILLIVGFVFFILELESEEAEFFGPITISCIIAGVLFWFLSGGFETDFHAPLVFFIASILVLVVSTVLVVLAVVVMRKFKAVTKIPVFEEQKMKGTGVTIDSLGPEVTGYIKFHGERWQARSETLINANTPVRVTGQDGLILVVEPVPPRTCYKCGDELPDQAAFCPRCGAKKYKPW